MKKWKPVLAAACTCALVTVAYAATAGSQDDPLVTLSYLNTVFKPQVERMAEDAVAAHQTELERALADAASGTGAAFDTVSLGNGGTLELRAGGEVLVLSGDLACSGTLTDVTAGGPASGALTPNHLYVATGSCQLTASGGAEVMVRNGHTIG